MKKILLVSMFLGVASFAAEVNLNACTGCHGKNFEKSALGKSKVVSQMTKEEIASAMIGYKNNTYGGPMKGVMKGQVVKYSDEELTAAAQKIKEL